MPSDIQSRPSIRWWMLLVLVLAFFELTLNWFNIAAAFPALGKQFGLQVPQMALLISLFLAGYGICHIPTGFLASRFGLRNVLLAGVLIESLASVACAFAPSYTWLAIWRVVAGVGGSFFVGTGFGLAALWFKDKELALGQGICTVGFGLGAGVAMYVWTILVNSMGWSNALILSGAIGVVIFLIELIFLRVPAEHAVVLRAGNLHWDSVGRTLMHRELWWYGLATFGGYAATLTVPQLVPIYASAVFKVSPLAAGLLGGLVLLIGIPAGPIGGFLYDRSRNRKAYLLVPMALAGLTLILLPYYGAVGVWILSIACGFLVTFQFAPFTSLPVGFGDHNILPQDVATAEGLLLTIVACGGFLVPIGFGQIEAAWGFPAAWVYMGIVCIVFMFFGFAGRQPGHALVSPQEQSKDRGVTS